MKWRISERERRTLCPPSSSSSGIDPFRLNSRRIIPSARGSTMRRRVVATDEGVWWRVDQSVILRGQPLPD